MAKFMESTSSIKNSVKKKKKEDESAKKKTTKAASSSKPKTQSSVSSKPKAQTQKTVNRLSNKYAGGSTRNTSKPKATTTKPKATTTTTTTAPKKATTTTSRNPRMQDAVIQSKPVKTTKRDTTPVSAAKSKQVQQNLQQKYGENKVNNTVKRDTTPVKSAADKAFEKQRDRVSVSRNPRMQDTARNTKVQSRSERQESLNTAKRAIRNTPTVAKESAKQVLQGHGKTAADVTAMNNSAAIGSRVEIKSPEFMRDIEKRREASTATARKTFKELAKAQDRSEQRLNDVTKNAKGLEKAYYGAVQSGTGILTDIAIGGGTQAGSLAAMGSRVYGNTRGTAQREGATENEDRLYSFMQAAKEVGTELMFPGVGLAGKAYGKRAALPLAERIANRATRNLTGKAADVAGAGIRLLGGTAEENLEEVAGWGLDPLIKEYTYGKNVRVRGTKNLMQQESNALRSNIRTREDADRAASYLNSQDFLDENIRQYMDAGLSQEQAQKAALQMRDYLTASLTGNTQEMQRLESDIMKTVSNKKWTLADWDRNELVDTLMSTTLLTGVTGLPGAVTTSRIGNNVFNDPDVRKFFGDDAQKVVANEVINSSDETNSLRAQAMRDRLNSGKDLTGTQKYDLWRGYQQKTMATAEKQSASVDLAERNIARNNYVQPVTLDENGRWSRAVRNEYEYYQLGDETQRKYEENFDSALATAETLRASVKSEEDSEAKSITETTEDRTRQAAAAVAALKDGYLTIGDVHEFGFGNTLARETLKAETGIDLNQYIVRNSDGTVNYAKTNEATENALFAIAADNMVKTAKAETETFIDHRKGEIDKDLMTRFGAEGQKAWKDINKSLDPRETARYLASANAASYMYAAGRNTTLDQNEAVRSMGNVFRTVDNNVLVKSFEAGRQDREIAMAPAVGQTVSATDSMAGTDTVSIPTGSLTMDEDMPRSIPDSEQQIYKALAEATGVNIHLASHLDLKDEEGNVIGQANGSSYGDTIILNVNSAAEQNLGYVFMHEMTHQIKKYAPAEYTKLENLIRDAWFEKDYVGMQREIKHKIDLYGNRAGQTLSEDMAMEEIVADAMAEAIDDPRFARAVCTEDVGMGRAILNSIRNALRSLRDMIANTVFRQNNNFHKNLLSYLDVLSEAESLWIRALNEATKARAAQAVNELQNRIYEEGRLSISADAEQEITSANTSINKNKLPAVFNRVDWQSGTTNFDNGGGKFDNATEFLATKGVTNYIYDRFNRSPEHNQMISDTLEERKADTGTISNVLNVIQEKASRIEVLENSRDNVKPDGKIYITVYEGDGSGIGRETSSGYQLNMKLRDYLPEVQEVFPDAYIRKSMIIAPNTGETSRFSVSEPVERVKDLIAVHNLKPDDIRNTFELGGFPMPSIAITKDSMGHDMYGDITLMFHSDTIDPKKKRTNEVFGGDAYTPVFPRIHYKASSKVEKRLSDLYYEWSQKYGYDTVRPFYEYGQNLQDALDRAGGEAALIDQLKSDSSLMRMYLRINDNDVEDVMKITEITMPEGEVDLSKRLIDALGEDDIRSIAPEGVTGREALQYRREWVDAHKEQLEKVYRDYFTSSGVLSEEDIEAVIPEIKPGEYAVAVRKALDYLRHGATTTKEEKDYEATTNAIKQAAEETGYDEWIDDLFKGVEEKRGLRNDRDMFTARGNRRKWESLYEPVTLDGVVRVMSQELSAGANGLLGANPKGASQKSYRSLDEIRADEDRLQQLPEEEFKALEEAAVQKLTDVCGEIVDSNSDTFQNRFGAVLDVGEYIAEILNTTRNKSTIKRKLSNDYNLATTDQQMDDLMEAIDAIANLPTGYFEAKPRRAVGFDEVKAAIIPASTDEDIKQGFNDRGIQMYEYDPAIEGDRTEKVNEAASVQDLRFSISADLDEPYMAAVNAGNMEEAQRLVDEAAKRAGYGTRLYHGTRDFGFTQIKTSGLESKSDGGYYEWSPFFATDSIDVAQTYSSVDDVKRISEASEPFDEDRFDDEYNDAVGSLVNAINEFAGTYNYMDYSVNPFIAAYKELQTTSHPADDIADDLIDNVSDIISELAWSRANDIVEANPDENRDVDDLADEIQEGPEASAIWVNIDIVNDMLRSYDEGMYGNASSGNYELLTNTDNMMQVDAKGHRWNDIPFDAIPERRGYYRTRQLAEIARDEGYDGIQIANLFDDGGHGKGKRQQNPATIYIFFKPENQVKSADPVTYAEDGSVIPLSERFDPSNNDIRYSLPTQDSDGNILSDGQMEYFQNSQARDEQGRLVPVYHTTKESGFTVFDPMQSDDKRSLFFTDSRKMSASYSKQDGRIPPILNSYDVTAPNTTIDNVGLLPDFGDVDVSAPSVLDRISNIKVTDRIGREIASGDDFVEVAQRVGRYLEEDGYDLYDDLGVDPYLVSNENNMGSKDGEAWELFNGLGNVGLKYTMDFTDPVSTYAAYLNLENPLIVDAHDHNWDEIPFRERPKTIRNVALYLEPQWDNTEDGDPLVNGYSLRMSWEEADDSELGKFLNNGWKKGLIDTTFQNSNPEDLGWFPRSEIERYVEASGMSVPYFYEVLGKAEEEPMDGSSRYESENAEEEIQVYTSSYNTREIAEIAQNEGYDGVIIKDVKDYGDWGYGLEPADVYIAFSSNQVKDTRNTNPTENPDIRWSVPEDEVKDRVAYTDAMDNSFEELEAYEAYISEHPDDVESYVAKHFDEETVAAFNSALVDYSGKMFDDKILEDGRVRIASSREDFFRSVNAKWRESWPTEGEVLNIDSVKGNIRKLVRGVMANADANHQYKIDVANMTLADARTAFQFMKQGREEYAMNLLYHSAQRMVEGIQFVQDDTEFETYKDIRAFMRNSRVSIDEEYWGDVDYQKFRRENLSRMKLIRGPQNVEDVYSDLQDNWPWIFNEEERAKIGLGDSVPDLLLHIGHVLDQNLTPFMAAYSSEEATELCFDIADQLYDIIEAGRPIKSLADSLGKRDAQKLDKLYDQMEENAANAQREYNKSIEELTEKFDQQTKALKVRHDEAVRKVKANMAEMEEAKNAEIDKLRKEANDTFLLSKAAIARERAAKWQAIEEEKAKRAKETERANMWRGRYKERVQKDVQDKKEKAEKKDHRKLFNGIQDDYDWLSKAVLDPTKDKYIPEAFRKSLADLLQLIDLQTENSKKLEAKYGRVAQKTLKMRELKDRLADLSTKKAADATNLFDIDAYLPYLMDAMAEKLDGQSIDAMDASDIKTFRILFKALRKNFQNLNRETAESKTAIALEKAEKIVAESMGKVKRDGLAKEYKGARAALNKINMTSLTPAYFFERMGTVNDIYRDLRRGFDTYIRNEKEITDKLTQILAPFYKKGKKISRGSDIEEWRDGRSAQSLELSYGTVTMTAAQRMSLLCLANRDQAMQHMMLGGIVVTPFEAGSWKESIKEGIKGKTELGDKVVLSKADIDTIRASLTPEQIKVATQLQQLMANDMADLGNEAHREMYGYEIFDDQDYFPIKSKDTWIPKDVNNMNDAVERIKSYGPAKPLDPNASNAIVIDDIFSVVADHCNGMNLYNAYLVPISNFMKVYNFTVTLEDGNRKPVMDALEEAYGKDALKYIDNFIRDLNGIKNTHRGGLEDVMDSAIGRAKATAVAGNIRVAAQQPTAIVRAAAEMNPKYLTPFLKVRPKKGVLDEMYKYCPIAQWKSWGYYDTYMGRDIEDVMMNNWSVKDTVLTGAYGMLDNLTWGAIWQAVKQEQHDLHPNMDMKSEAFLRICGDRASEIFDKTQVVDSTFHRSDAMRNKDRWMKLFTAFMSEPTLTLNVFRAAVYNASEAWKAGDKTKAAGIMNKAISVLLVQAAFVSVAQALADAWRGKDPGLPWDDDDDDEPDESYWARFLHNWIYNMFDQLHLENNMYLVKDITPAINYMISKGADYWNWNPTLRAMMGWDQDYLYSQNNLVFSALDNAATGVGQIFKKLEKGEDYNKDWYDIMQKTLSGFGTAFGIPAGTLMRDFKPIWDKVFASAFASDSTGEIAKVVSSIGKNGKSDSKKSDASSSDSEGSWDDVYKQMEAEEEQLAKLEEKAAKKAASAPAGQKDEVLWDTLTDGYTTKLKEGRMDYIDSLRDIYVRNGGREEVFDSKLLDGIKRSYKSTINADNTADQMEGQYDMQQYMLNHGITAEEISDMCYHSYTAKDLKAAMRLGNEEYMIDELVPLIQAGFSEEDFNKCWKQRYNYRSYTGKYTDPKYRISTGTYAWPITGTITSRFGGRSAASTNGVGSTNHMGLDIAGSMGDPVHAADGGEVIYADWWYGGGNVVRIRHENGEVTEYMHLSGYNCKVGDHVGKGDQIGQVGSTGNSTGPHLHFGVMDKNGNHLDPEVILAQSNKG